MKQVLQILVIVLLLQLTLTANYGGACSSGDSATHTEWFYGDTEAQQCVDNTCSSLMSKYLEIFGESQTVSTISVAQPSDDETKVELKIDTSVATCGAGNDEECISDSCFKVNIFTAAEWAKGAGGGRTAVSQDANATINAAQYTIDKTFYTGADCTVNNAGDNPVYTCGFVAQFILSDIEESIGTKTFNVELTQLGGADLVQGEVDISLVAIAQTLNSEANRQSYIRNDATTQTGTLAINNAGTIYIGDQVDFTLTGPANFDNRLFNISEGISLKLVHNTNVEISISPKADPENSAANEGDANTLTFSIDANYIGTYTVKVEATLTGEQPAPIVEPIVPPTSPGGNRLLEEIEQLQTIIGHEPVTLTVYPTLYYKYTNLSFVTYALGALLLASLGVILYQKIQAKSKKDTIQYDEQETDIEN